MLKTGPEGGGRDPSGTGTDYAAAWTGPTSPGSHSPGAAFSGSFEIHEVAGNDGAAPISWRVYRSADAILDGGDADVASGTETALFASSSVSVNYSGTWPSGNGAYYYLIVDISASDDENPLNDRTSPGVSDRIPVPEPFSESEPNSDGPPSPAAYDALAASPIDNGRLILISGTTDGASGAFDTFRFVAGTMVNKVFLTARWSSGTDEIDLHVWEDGLSADTSAATTSDAEPAPGDAPWRTPGLSSGTTYFIGVESKSTSTVAYDLLVRISN